MAARISNKTKVVYIANPNNPTGTMITRADFDAFMKKVPSQVLVILDEAYYEYAKHSSEFTHGFGMEYENVIVCRTFSKAYGMAGFRVGYGVSTAENIYEVLKVKLPFEPTVIAQYAAMKALDDTSFLQKTLDLNEKGMQFFQDNFAALGIQYVADSYANFYMMLFDGEVRALTFAEKCLEKGLILRYLDMFGFPEAVRINTGTMEENQIAFDIMKDVLQELA
ncbi:MAG: histidinol-phosphate transaminase [Bdellovibrionota bacterium]